MKKTARFFSLALAILMLIPMLSVFPVKVSATGATYDATHNGELLRTVNFNAPEWKQGFADDNNKGADVEVSNDGNAVSLTVQNANNKRAMWGGFYSGAADGSPEDLAYDAALGEVQPMETGVKYTFVFDLTLGNDNVGFGIMADGNNTLVIRGDGQSRWYQWNTLKVGETGNNKRLWSSHIASGTTTRDQHTFAVVVDYDAKTMSLYVLDENYDAFYFCRSITCDDSGVWDSDYLRSRLNVRSLNGTADETYTADVSNLNIYKGDALSPLFGDGYRLPYWTRDDGEKLADVNFNGNEWRQGFATEHNVGADVTTSEDGSAVFMTVQNANNKRAMWGGFYSNEEENSPEEAAFEEHLGTTLPLCAGAKYTMVFDLTLGDNRVAFGVQVDGHNSLLIEGNGQSFWYGWNTLCVDATTNGDEKWDQHIAEGSTRRDQHTFAVTVDYDAKTMALYVLDENDGAFYFCRSITYSDAHVWDSAYFRCRLYVRSMYGTPTEETAVRLANLQIYKGDALYHLWDDLYTLPYDYREDGDKLMKANFNASGWKRACYDQNNCGAIPVISTDGTEVDFTVTTDSYKRAMWGGFYPGAGVDEDEFEAGLGTVLPMKPGAKYTLIFNLTLGDNRVGFGVQVDGRNTLLIEGNGQSFWYGWNTLCVDATTNGDEKWDQHIASGTNRRSPHTFAVTVDYDAKTMALYVKNGDVFCFCRSITYSDAHVWDSAYFRCRFYVRSMYGTPDEHTTASVSDLSIYKGTDLVRTANVSVMSYNVEVYHLDSPDGWRGRNPKKALNTVLSNSPDIVGLQEVDFAWDTSEWDEPEYQMMLSTFATVGGYTRLTGSYTTASNFEKNEIFYKTSKFNLISEGTRSFYQTAIDLSVPNTEGADQSLDSAIRRVFHYAVLQEIASGKTILVVNTHLHYGATGNGAQEHDKLRRYEIRTLLAWLQTQEANYPNQIVLGDMNAHYTSPNGGAESMNLFFNSGYERTSATAEVKRDVGGTTTRAVRTIRQPYIFDYILNKGTVETRYYTVVDNKIDYNSNNDLSYPSDHLPILAKMTLY
ncbi:MAG: endonuclease/exonuclease/phosphatase family protein [Clostridia bacterium]|nr:endonuclease/exonuclease/phosphatase family protein [Clostridia bacterium]